MNNIQTLIQAVTTHHRSAERQTTHPNRERAPSYHRSLKEQVVQVLVSFMF